MDEYTYRFEKKTFFKETNNTNIPSEVKEIARWLKSKGFVMTHLQNPQMGHYSKEVYEGSYSLDFKYDLGVDKRQVLVISILKNQWTNWLTEWWFRLDEIMKDNKFNKGNDTEELKDTIIDFLELEIDDSPEKYVQMSLI